MKKFLEQKKSAIVSGMSNNKGFSLVELIIVVAIMAVLMGVLAPQYLRFVETSREGTDRSSANEIVKNMTTAISIVEKIPVGAMVGWDKDGELVFGGLSDDEELKAFAKEITATLGTNIGPIASTVYQNNPPVFAVGQDKSTSVPFVYDVTAYDDDYITYDDDDTGHYAWKEHLRIKYFTELNDTEYNLEGAALTAAEDLEAYGEIGSGSGEIGSGS